VKEQDRSWRVTASRGVVRDRWIDLRADTCVAPSGAVLDPYYVLSYADWVHVVALTPDDRLVMNRQYRHAAGEVHLELPGGVMDAADASPLDTARRELREETGYAAAEFRPVIALRPNPATHTNRVHTVLALGAHLAGLALGAHLAGAQSLDPGEEITAELVPIPLLLRGLREGAVQQSTHVASALLALAAAGRVAL
jgi:8-oxo-dGTP pyrophosphatase MutT (NUDIX family)